VAEFQHANAGKRRGIVGMRLSVGHRNSLGRHSHACPALEAEPGRRERCR
jgi:hypothetical protein